ncbi:hypothetical protein E0Z10_g3975 [Xylaria hypoxylon]|uniref:CobW C-terminal domain-containing protein n=1 Tax=Xylaria hypoxylon TaxID=37992 RepID=A0A4Z0Z093_9PEZI|nr:hypothetical protein E0Z10_g3975 [Xylaria hypoxylon]
MGDHGYRVAVIVNDVGAVNMDAALISTHDVTRKREHIIGMQNGCICCTLRGDLLEEVARLAKDKRIDYLIIESSGFAEMSIAAGYDLEKDDENEMGKEQRMRLTEILKADGLSKVARLDTCVTIVDAVNFMRDFATADFLKDRQSDVPEGDDQDVNRVKGNTVKTLNPGAKVITAVKSSFDLSDILDTHMFCDVFIVIQEYLNEEDNQNGDGDAMDTAVDGEEEEFGSEMEDSQPLLDTKARLESKVSNETFGPPLRFKGFLWLATRPLMYGEWSQAGVMLTPSGGDVWRCEMPESEWPNNPTAKQAIMRDFQGTWGDRRQEIVFIGQKMRERGEARLRKALDWRLLDDAEFRDWERAMTSKNPQKVLDRVFDDGFEDRVVEVHDHDHDDGHGHGH